ncbi:hypothetical protein IQ37_03415 [Chryseobacterium piperi]|uniref:PQ loop repeat protein n=1 Tax=Chryseobacterium piperi TaxID=558152 RepID=A0A086BL99_9FLAO|nr:hypothetical protein CJF12_03080 [Chryseobacterium piperi]KFF29713.1 hypothetical protein IQ37_03415 [Chryseobacterium piperi]
MNFWNVFIIVFLIGVFNSIVYIIFKRYLQDKPNAAMRFLMVNIVKDVIWFVISLLLIDKTRSNFIFLIICFVAASFFIYFLVIKQINKS